MKNIFKDIRFYIVLVFFLLIAFYVAMMFIGENVTMNSSSSLEELSGSMPIA
jgi:hypothetical protein